jgi:hypothetical protein
MAKMKFLEKENVLTCGAGQQRIVLDFESGLCYRYQNPEDITAVYERGTWYTPKRAYYHRGGWGRSSSGDYDLHSAIENTQSLIDTIGGRRHALEIPFLPLQKEIEEIERKNKKIDELNKKIEKLNLDHSLAEEKTNIELKFWNKPQKGKDPGFAVKNMKKAVDIFVNQLSKKISVDQYVVTKDLVKQNNTTVAVRSNGKVYLNSEMLQVTRLENQILGGQSIIQSEIRKIANYSIPFNVLESAKLNLTKTKILEQGPEENFTIKKHYYSDFTEERHFTGALLLENSGRKFLMDIDREEIKHKIFNPFFVEVNSKVKTIQEAYESMKPQEVKEAEKAGIKVIRQGEFFFIKTGRQITISTQNIHQYDRENKQDQGIYGAHISLGKGRPNSCLQLKGFEEKELNGLVCGKVQHTGREHRDVDLGVYKVKGNKKEQLKEYDTWDLYKGYEDDNNNIKYAFDLWKVVPNTTLGNFTITGDID